MAYLPLHNFKYDSGPRRIQSGPDHEGYIVVTSGVNALGADNGIIVDGTPLSGVRGANQRWGYDANWRYVPATARSQIYAVNPLNPAESSISGVLTALDGVRVSTKLTIANSQVSSAIGPAYGVINPRGAALQSNSTALHPERYMYFGGGAPDNQSYTPYNTPDSNTAAEGTTGGGVTRRNYENSLLLNSLGSQGTSDRSQWVYHQPVYCTTYAQSVRPTTPGLMSTVVRSTYRGSATSYNANFGYLLRGSFDPDPGTADNDLLPLEGLLSNGLSLVNDTLTTNSQCELQWYRDGDAIPGATSSTYTPTAEDLGSYISVEDSCGFSSDSALVVGYDPRFTQNGGIKATVTFRRIIKTYWKTNCSTGTIQPYVESVLTSFYLEFAYIRTATFTTGGAPSLANTISYSIACNAGTGNNYRINGGYVIMNIGGGSNINGYWGNNIILDPNQGLTSFHSTVITSIVLAEANPAYGGVGDEVLPSGILEAVSNGDNYWTATYVSGVA